MMDVQEATRKDYPAKQFNRTTRPIWRVVHISPEEQSIDSASCVGFACPECDIRAFRLIDKPPPIENITLPAAFAEYCADCCKGGLSSSRHKCLGKWMSELAYRSCQYKRNCLSGFLEASILRSKARADRDHAPRFLGSGNAGKAGQHSQYPAPAGPPQGFCRLPLPILCRDLDGI